MCDAIEHINSLFSVHLIPVMFAMLMMDIFVIYKAVRFMLSTAEIYKSLIISYYIVIHFMLRSAIAHYGHTLTSAVLELKSKVARLIIDLPINHDSREAFNEFLRQIETRNYRMETVFFSINWNIVISVSVLHKDKLR
jgi:hypothetical protein